MEIYRLCYVEGNKAWFTNDFEHQWGDDWNDRPYEHNAGWPYDFWHELIEDNVELSKRKFKEHKIKHKILHFEVESWNDQRPCEVGEYSVEDINKQAIAWIHTDKFNILAGTKYEDFIDTIEKNGGKIYLPNDDLKKKLLDSNKYKLYYEKVNKEYIPKRKLKKILQTYKYVSVDDTEKVVQFYEDIKKLTEEK